MYQRFYIYSTERGAPRSTGGILGAFDLPQSGKA